MRSGRSGRSAYINKVANARLTSAHAHATATTLHLDYRLLVRKLRKHAKSTLHAQGQSFINAHRPFPSVAKGPRGHHHRHMFHVHVALHYRHHDRHRHCRHRPNMPPTIPLPIRALLCEGSREGSSPVTRSSRFRGNGNALVRLVRLVVCSSIGPAIIGICFNWRFKRAALHYIAPGVTPSVLAEYA